MELLNKPTPKKKAPSKLKRSQSNIDVLKSHLKLVPRGTSGQTSKTVERRRLWDHVDLAPRHFDAPYSSFGLLGAFDLNNSPYAVAGGTIIRVQNWLTLSGWTKWVYVVAAAHDIVIPHYDGPDERGDYRQVLKLFAPLNRFKFYPRFSGTDAQRRLVTEYDAWQLRRVWFWPTYKQVHVYSYTCRSNAFYVCWTDVRPRRRTWCARRFDQRRGGVHVQSAQ